MGIGRTKTQITVSELDRMLEQNENFLLLDTRNDEEFERWQIEGRYPPETLHIPYFAFLEEEETNIRRIPKGKPMVVVCAKGGASDYVVGLLRERGYEAANLEGGMIAWGNYYRLREIPATSNTQHLTPNPLSIYQLSRVSRGDLSYVVRSDSEAVAIDPTRHVERFTELAGREGFRIVAVLDTHAHADHISGGPALARLTGAPYYLHPYDGIHPIDVLPAKIEYQRLWDGFTIRFGDATLEAIHIPGHTLGNMAFLVNDQYLFTGDSIFIRSIARPDLGGKGDAWAPLHYDSIYNRLLSLPGDTIALPGHFSKPDEAQPDGAFYDTLENLKRANRELQFESKEAFVEFILSHLPEFPKQYVEIKRVNAGLVQPTEEQANELELGKNICALSEAYN